MNQWVQQGRVWVKQRHKVYPAKDSTGLWKLEINENGKREIIRFASAERAMQYVDKDSPRSRTLMWWMIAGLVLVIAIGIMLL